MHATLCDYLADIVQNAIEAGASRITIELIEDGEQVKIAVTDNGKGMDAARQARIWDPFYSEPGKHNHRRVGLGLPLLRQAVEATGGEIALTSSVGQGTSIHFTFAARHFDTPPLGDLPNTMLGLLTHDGAYDLCLTRTRFGQTYAISRAELADALGDLREAGNLTLARDFLRSQEDDLIHTTTDDLADASTGGQRKE